MKNSPSQFFAGYLSLTKFGIVIFVLLSALAGYLLSFESSNPFLWWHLVTFLVGVYALSSGSLALNQFQDREMDQHMPRTAKRPLVNGLMKPMTGLGIALALLLVGSLCLYMVSVLSLVLGWAVVVLYNILYSLWWKPKWLFAAVPGALPGALPVTMGYAANSQDIFSSESVYLFLILFLWQMPHFWALALRYKDDYSKANIPVLPVRVGRERTLLHMGIYVFVYVAVAMASPWFVQTGWVHVFLTTPFAIWVLIEFFNYAKKDSAWLRFFMGVNLSVLVFLFAPAFEKWSNLFY